MEAWTRHSRKPPGASMFCPLPFVSLFFSLFLSFCFNSGYHPSLWSSDLFVLIWKEARNWSGTLHFDYTVWQREVMVFFYLSISTPLPQCGVGAVADVNIPVIIGCVGCLLRLVELWLLWLLSRSAAPNRLVHGWFWLLTGLDGFLIHREDVSVCLDGGLEWDRVGWIQN